MLIPLLASLLRRGLRADPYPCWAKLVRKPTGANWVPRIRGACSDHLRNPGCSRILHLAAPVSSPHPVGGQQRLQTVGRSGGRVHAATPRLGASPAHLVRDPLGLGVPEGICTGLIQVIRVPDVDEQELGDSLVLTRDAEGPDLAHVQGFLAGTGL